MPTILWLEKQVGPKCWIRNRVCGFWISKKIDKLTPTSRATQGSVILMSKGARPASEPCHARFSGFHSCGEGSAWPLSLCRWGQSLCQCPFSWQAGHGPGGGPLLGHSLTQSPIWPHLKHGILPDFSSRVCPVLAPCESGIVGGSQ